MHPYCICDDCPDEIQHAEPKRDVVCKAPLVGSTSDALNVGGFVEIARVVLDPLIVVEDGSGNSVARCDSGVGKGGQETFKTSALGKYCVFYKL